MAASIEYNYINFLQDEYLRRLNNNPLFSQRAFAKLLGLSPGALSEIMSGKRKLTYKNALKLASKLGLSTIDTKNFVMLLDDTKSSIMDQSGQKKKFQDKKLTDDIFSIVSNWYCFAILNLVDCHDFKWSITWIASRLNISANQVKDAIEKMTRVGLLQKLDIGYATVEDFVLSPDGVPSRAVRNYHHQILDKAKLSLEEQNVDDREISGISLAINSKHLPMIKKDVDNFQREIIEKYCKGRRDEVYQLEFALFKLTK